MCVQMLRLCVCGLHSGNATLTAEVTACRPWLPVGQRSAVLRGIAGDTLDLQARLNLNGTLNVTALPLSKIYRGENKNTVSKDLSVF